MVMRAVSRTSCVSSAGTHLGGGPFLTRRTRSIEISTPKSRTLRTLTTPSSSSAAATAAAAMERRSRRRSMAAAMTDDNVSAFSALIFDCDGVIVESENIHREAYNAAFEEFKVSVGNDGSILDWSEEFYDVLQNTVGGGKPKMRWYFAKHGWPTSSVFDGSAPRNEAEQEQLIDTLQDWKTQKYKDIIKHGVEARPGVEALMDLAKAKGIPVAVCSAATKEAVIFVLENLLGKERFEGLDLFMAGDDVTAKKPDPMIYNEAAKRLNKDPATCLVVEDSVIGLQAARGAGMSCVITYTQSTKDQDFSEASAIFRDLRHVDGHLLLSNAYHGFDSRRS